MEFAVFLLTLLAIGGAMAAAMALAKWVARPIESLAQSHQVRSQFALSDLLVLFAMLQFAVGTVHYLAMMDARPGAASDPPTGTYVLDAFVAVFALLCWWCGVSLVSQAGIQRWWHRIIILVLVVPGGIVSSVVMVFLLIAAVSVGIGGEYVVAACIGGVACILLICVCACGLLTRWIAAKYRPSEVACRPDSVQISPPSCPSPEEP